MATNGHGMLTNVPGRRWGLQNKRTGGFLLVEGGAADGCFIEFRSATAAERAAAARKGCVAAEIPAYLLGQEWPES